MNVAAIQTQLREQDLDGWLFFDHHQRDPLAYRVLGLSPARHVTRRWYYFIPVRGEPRGLVHRVESGMLDSLPGEKTAYSSWTEQVEGLRAVLAGANKIAMQYSPLCAIPYVALVDAGTVELVRSQGIDVTSSAELIQYFEARWTAAGLESHLEAGRRIDRIRRDSFQLIGERTRNGVVVEELEVKQFVLDEFRRNGLVTDSGPIVGVNRNAANPHYEPDHGHSEQIRRGDFVLLDLWAKLDQPDSIVYDITWTAFCGDPVLQQIENVFVIVRDARNAAVKRVKEAVAAGQTIRGFEVDDVARRHIAARGFGAAFTHRTGHSIGQETHGNGANMDNLETHDERRIIPWTGFSIEPGIYLRDFGVRSEVNVFVNEREARVTGEIQTEVVLI
jgi:Xaa-Pro dipeptidase